MSFYFENYILNLLNINKQNKEKLYSNYKKL
jgi:hypothetical protein